MALDPQRGQRVHAYKGEICVQSVTMEHAGHGHLQALQPADQLLSIHNEVKEYTPITERSVYCTVGNYAA
jgi:hypothetical protein